MPPVSTPYFPHRSRRFLGFLLAMLLAPQAVPGDVAAESGDAFEFDEFALYVPASERAARGILLVLGGPDTRAFVTGGMFGAPGPELEASLHQLGRDLRTLADDLRITIIGTSYSGQDALPDQPGSDELMLDAVQKAAGIGGRHELEAAPIVVYGISGGAAEAAGFAARNPRRVGAVLLKAPGPPPRLSGAKALAVPALLILAGEDALRDNQAAIEVFESNRRAGGLWAVALEPGVPHHSLTPRQRALTVNWLRAILELRLGASAQDPLRAVPEALGWLGGNDIGVADWAAYAGDRNTASWFPSRATAEEWWAFTNGK